MEIVISAQSDFRLTIKRWTVNVDAILFERNVIIKYLHSDFQILLVCPRLTREYRNRNLFDTSVDPVQLVQHQLALSIQVQIAHVMEKVLQSVTAEHLYQITLLDTYHFAFKPGWFEQGLV